MPAARFRLRNVRTDGVVVNSTGADCTSVCSSGVLTVVVFDVAVGVFVVDDVVLVVVVALLEFAVARFNNSSDMGIGIGRGNGTGTGTITGYGTSTVTGGGAGGQCLGCSTLGVFGTALSLAATASVGLLGLTRKSCGTSGVGS